MRRLFIGLAAFQIALSPATAQQTAIPAKVQSVSLDQSANGGAIAVVQDPKLQSHLQLLLAPETAIVLPLAALQLLLPSLINGATSQSGIASIYSGGMTANGEHTLVTSMTAAHRSIPFGTNVRVTNRANGKSIVVTINDRGPFVGGRIIDLMPSPARALGFSGLTPVTLVIVSAKHHDD